MLNIVSVYVGVMKEKVIISLVSELIDMLSTEIHCRVQFCLKTGFIHACSLKVNSCTCLHALSFITANVKFSTKNKN